jgi:cell division protein ZapE
LFARGVTVVATSNVSPDDLYEDGLNRALFFPFIALLKQHMAVFRLEAPRDFRLDDAGTERRYVTHGPEAPAILRAQFRDLAGRERGIPRKLPHKGRSIDVPEAADGVAFFRFEELCGLPLAASDYLRLADEFHTIVLAGVPMLDATRRNEAKRFINLIDALYDNHVRMVVSAAAEPSRLWRGSDDVETREFARTASRLVEMQSDDYWEESGAHRAQIKKARA